MMLWLGVGEEKDNRLLLHFCFALIFDSDSILLLLLEEISEDMFYFKKKKSRASPFLLLAFLKEKWETHLAVALCDKMVCVHALALLTVIKYACTWRAQGPQSHWGLLPSARRTLECECFTCADGTVNASSPSHSCVAGTLLHQEVGILWMYARNIPREGVALYLTTSSTWLAKIKI